MATTPAGRHIRNPQGTGGRLRADILAAAGRILESTGSDDAVTLRAIAREAGITAPAIYAHFADRDAIRRTVIEQTFTQLATVLTTAADTEHEPVARLHVVCHAYLDFAARRPHHYRLLFERHRAARGADAGPAAPDVGSIVGADAFGVLLQAADSCIRSGASTAVDPVASATRVWVGLHGQATLQASLPWFPWPPADRLATDVVRRMADLR
ncbi:transcriptional regulator, TetR family [Jatrophihabitans endophyticus]|uniref:Transcriptional regulator, TetR family n=1 Tax=Jatrophihabitans endophyticus TaxID=1206085 RepID=A0A1M5EFY1_9ACTN|nr:TetR/AcrR family transcriptional regulator [Jatrophihabitans endophyticus]SHF78138.1 transcriptional regulator, TetR family [Jatrophihabitans endophyticus]